MNIETSTRTHRDILTFTLQGLAPKDALVFKSIVRLLDHRTHQSWQLCSEAEATKADLLVVASGAVRQPEFSMHYSTQRVLGLGAGAASREFFLCIPLHADDMEVELNRLGSQIKSSASVINSINFTNSTNSIKEIAPAAAGMAATPVRLLRWPAANLVGTRERMRLATLMASQPTTLAMLQQRSGLDATVCSAFFMDLEKAGYLSAPVAPVAPAATAALVASGARPAVGVGESEDPVHSELSNRPGLLSLIRNRFGIQLFGAH